MKPHQRIEFPDSSVAVRFDPGDEWVVWCEEAKSLSVAIPALPRRGRQSYAKRFCDEQNAFVLVWHAESVRAEANGDDYGRGRDARRRARAA